MTRRFEVKMIHPLAQMLNRATPGSAGFDLVACVDEPVSIRRGNPAELIPTGLEIHIADPSIAALIIPRSSYGHKKGLVLGNGTGLIDSDYTKQWFVSAWNRGQLDEIVIAPGERIAQVIFVPVITDIDFVQVTEFSATDVYRTGGFGSTGK